MTEVECSNCNEKLTTWWEEDNEIFCADCFEETNGDCGGCAHEACRRCARDEEDEEDPFDCKCIICDKVFATAEESCGWTQRERTFCSKKCEETMPDWTSDEEEEEGDVDDRDQPNTYPYKKCCNCGDRKSCGMYFDDDWYCEDCYPEDEEETPDEWFDRKYPNASCFRCDTKVTGATVVHCGGAGGACETWYCADCHEQGTEDCNCWKDEEANQTSQ